MEAAKKIVLAPLARLVFFREIRDFHSRGESDEAKS